VQPKDSSIDLSHFDANSLELNGGTIRRDSAHPTTDALLTLPLPHPRLHYHDGGSWKDLPSTRLGGQLLTVESVQVTLRKLYHPNAADLRVRLAHNGRVVTLFDQSCAGKTFGKPGPPAPNNPVNGDGYDYHFTDIEGTNLALAGTATQSSTAYGGVASRAIDGGTSGLYSDKSVTHTGGHGLGDPQPWWQVKLAVDDSTPLGTIKLWNREVESSIHEIQVVQVTSLQAVNDSMLGYQSGSRGVHLGSCGSQMGGNAAASGLLQNTTVCDDVSFRLLVPFGGLGSLPANTTAIRYDAVAEISEESEDPLHPAPGARPGESVQAKLQELPNVGQVRVRRSAPDAGGGYQWAVTFIGSPGNLAEMTVSETNISVVHARATVHTVQDGNDNRFYNYASGGGGEVSESGIQGRMTPGWLMVLPDSFTNASNTHSLETAKAAALWKVRLTDTYSEVRADTIYAKKRQVSVTLPPGGLLGRFIRYQLEGTGYLSLAEVQVYELRNRPLSGYSGGSPISPSSHPGGTNYAPEQSLDDSAEGFRGQSAEGEWQLLVQDMSNTHGQGGLSDWVLRITDTHGYERVFHMNVVATVETMPRYGNLFIGISENEREHLDRNANMELDREEATDFLRHQVRDYHRMDHWTQQSILDSFLHDYALHGAVRLQEEEGLQRYLSPCYGHVTDTYSLMRYSGQNDYLPSSTCPDQYRVGNVLSTSREGATAAAHYIRDERTVRYVPASGYQGKDSFTYRVSIGNVKSEIRGTVSLDVRVCRGSDECRNDHFATHDHQRHGLI